MSKVAIVGTGQTKFSKDDEDIEKLLFESASNCIQSVNNCDSNNIDGVLVSTNSNSKYLGAILSETMGIQPKISHSIEHLCSSGGKRYNLCIRLHFFRIIRHCTSFRCRICN